MANTFPSTGNVGIGTTSPETLLTLDTGTNNTTLVFGRIKGRSPTWIFGSGASGYTGGESFIGLVTVNGEYLSDSLVGDTFFFNGGNSGRTFIGRTAGNLPVVAVHNSNANVAIGMGSGAITARLVAAGPIPEGAGAVQLQGSAAPVGMRTLALGYGGSFNGMGMDESAYIQVEQQGVEQHPLRLQPLGGSVYIGDVSGALSSLDVSPSGLLGQSRFLVIQGVDTIPSSMIGYVMATFDMRSTIARGVNNSDVGCGRFFFAQFGGGAWFRGLESQARRYVAEPGENNRSWGVEVGLYNEYRGENAATSVGIYLLANNPAHRRPSPEPFHHTRRLNTGILIEGDSSDPQDGGHGWDKFILCRKGTGDSGDRRFDVDRVGNVWAKGEVRAIEDIFGERDIYSFNTVQAGDAMYATQFITWSSADQKENIVQLDGIDAATLLLQLTPVRYNLKARPGRQLMGFVVENVPEPFNVEGKGVDVMSVVATLAAVVKAQRTDIERLNARLDAMQAGGATP